MSSMDFLNMQTSTWGKKSMSEEGNSEKFGGMSQLEDMEVLIWKKPKTCRVMCFKKYRFCNKCFLFHDYLLEFRCSQEERCQPPHLKILLLLILHNKQAMMALQEMAVLNGLIYTHEYYYYEAFPQITTKTKKSINKTHQLKGK